MSTPGPGETWTAVLVGLGDDGAVLYGLAPSVVDHVVVHLDAGAAVTLPVGRAPGGEAIFATPLPAHRGSIVRSIDLLAADGTVLHRAVPPAILVPVTGTSSSTAPFGSAEPLDLLTQQPVAEAPSTTDVTTTTAADPVTAADVAGIVWASTDDPPPSPHGAWAQFPITWFMLLPDGSIRAADGCRRFASDPGSWRIEAGTLTTAPIPFGEDTCGDDARVSPFDDGPITLEATADGRLAMSTARTSVLAEPLDDANRVSTSAIVGRWTDGGRNTFEFRADGILRFTAETTCDGSYALTDGRLDVSFGECTGTSVFLSFPIFRSATAHQSRWTNGLLINGDAGVIALVPAP